MDIVHSVNGVPIRMTAERWKHIVENHNDLAGYYESVLRTVEGPDLVLPGYGGTLQCPKSKVHGLRLTGCGPLILDVGLFDFGPSSQRISQVRSSGGRRYGPSKGP